jgi:CBS domain-containing protein
VIAENLVDGTAGVADLKWRPGGSTMHATSACAQREAVMTVKAILDKKGRDVVTISPQSRMSDAVRALAEHRIGAIVVTEGDDRIAGILSERDIVRLISEKGPEGLGLPVSVAMTSKVRSCNEASTVHQVMELMTNGRFRHLPVEREGRLAGIISIGDVVKQRIEDVEREADEIRTYIATA